MALIDGYPNHKTIDGDDDKMMQWLIGKTVDKITQDDMLELYIGDVVFQFWHSQDCCESVVLESVAGDLNDLIGTPILRAEMKISGGKDQGEYGTHTYTFYTLATIKGWVDLRFLGESNGYYSESVDLCIWCPEEKFNEIVEQTI